MLADQWSLAVQGAFALVWSNLIVFIPKIILALLVFALGWILGVILGRIVEQITRALKIDKALRSAGVDELVEKIGFKLNAAKLMGGLVKWFIVIAFFTLVLGILELNQVTTFMWSIVLMYLPRVIVAVLIMMIAAILAQAAYDVVLGAAKASGIKTAKFMASFAKWAIWVFALIIVLPQLGIAAAFLQTLFAGFVIALSLAFGLAFGLGGKEEAAKILANMRKELSNND